MRLQRLARQFLVRRIVIVALLIIAIVGLVRIIDGLGDPPLTQQEAEAHLDRSILAYAVWEGVPYVVFEYGDVVHFDRLILDWISIEWPPTPRWQWSGMWSLLEPTNDPASVGRASTGENRVIYGQVNFDDIVWLEVRADGEWRRYPVSSPGFAIRLPDDLGNPAGYRWLDTEEQVVWALDDTRE